MNVLLSTIEYPPFKGGVSSYYKNLVKYWPKKDQIFVLDNNNGKLISSWMWPRWLPSIWNLRKEIRKNKIEHILVGQILPLGTAVYLATIFKKIPYSVFIHGMDICYAQKSWRKKIIAKKILRKADKIICASSYTASLVEEFMSKNSTENIRIVNPGIEIDGSHVGPERIQKFKKEHSLNDKIVLLSIGRLVKRKGFDKVIEAMPEVIKSIPNLYYFIAGKGPDDDYLRERAKDSKNIVFLGPLSENDKWLWLNACDVFITVSREIEGDFEGFGIVYLEANVCGKPVIAGDSGGVRDAVEGAISGIIIDSNNTERIASSIIRLAEDKNLRDKLGQQGKDRATKEFNWKIQTEKIYNLIINKK